MHERRSFSIIYICCILSVLLISLIPIPISAAAPTLSAEVKPAADGKTVTVIFLIENNPGIASFRFTMNYDNTVLKPVQTVCKISSGMFNDNLKDATTQLNVVWVFSGTNYTGNGELCSAVFSVIGTVKDGQYPITITYDQADIVSIDDGNPKSVSCEVRGITVSAQTVSIQSTQSVSSSVPSAVSQAQSSSPVSIASTASAVSSIPSSSTGSTATGTPQIEINSQVLVPDYTNSPSSGSGIVQSMQSASDSVQSGSNGSSQTQSPGAESETSYPAISQPSGEQIPTEAPDRQGPDALVITVLIIAVAAVFVLTVLFISKKTTKHKQDLN